MAQGPIYRKLWCCGTRFRQTYFVEINFAASANDCHPVDEDEFGSAAVMNGK